MDNSIITNTDWHLRNWALAQQQGAYPHPWPFPQAISAESQYRSPQHWWPEEFNYALIDYEAAGLVHSVWCTFPAVQRLVVVAEYVSPWRRRELRIPKFLYEKYLASALEVIAKKVSPRERKNDSRNYQSAVQKTRQSVACL